MRIWVDDIRAAPDETWTIARNYDEAIKLLQMGFVHVISLDHDLGEDSKTGYDIVNWMESTLRCGNIANIGCRIEVHSANPLGRANIERAIQAIEIWKQSVEYFDFKRFMEGSGQDNAT